MFLHKTPSLFFHFYPGLTWRRPGQEKEIYLTFDDGPIPELTPWVLDQLDQYKAKATFFCVGENVDRHADIFKRVVSEQHGIGNHTYNHLNGWKTDSTDYLKNVLKADESIRKYVETSLFRPPYGKITRKQIQQLHYKEIVMWDVLSGDFSQKCSQEQVLDLSIKHSKQGSIVVFHENLKAEKNLKFALPRFLEHFASHGYSFKTL